MSFENLNVDPSNEGGSREQGSQKPEEVTDPARLNIIVVNISMSIDLNDISQTSHRWTVETMKEDHRWYVMVKAALKIQSEICHYQ